ncbi:MAG: metal-dependent phosphohydrolase [Propionibacterium sp.]|nr:metal-dependent phosphohydrolase [Propionibacterium sp.]
MTPRDADRRLADLGARWRALLPGADDVFAELVRRWDGPDRRYHNLQHLTEALSALDLLAGTRLDQLAIWFHDAVHGLGAGADERGSADLARERLGALELPPDEIGEVVRLVLVTESHAPPVDDPAGARVSDCDMAILAADPERYDESVRGIRTEYSRFNDDEFHRGRVAVLDDLLSRPRIFHTDRGFDLWEVRARGNITRELLARRRDS